MQLAPSLAQRLEDVQSGIASAAEKCGRHVSDITLIVVTKFHPASLVRELADLGITNVGENRHQEAEAKYAELRDLTHLRWHFIGQLQSNKARAVRRYADVVHSVDRSSLVSALDSGDPAEWKHPRLDVLVQMNLTSDGARGGAADADDMLRLADDVAERETLRLRGIMAVAPLDEDPAAAFERVRLAHERLCRAHPEAAWLSMGMSHDYEPAIEHGATHLRIGTAITGYRPAPG